MPSLTTYMLILNIHVKVTSKVISNISSLGLGWGLIIRC